MKFLGKLVVFILSAIIATIDCTAPNRVCTQAEKIYYGTYKFANCERGQSGYWWFKGWIGRMDFFKKIVQETDPDFKEGSNCSNSRYSTSCDYLRFLTQVCGSHYKVCHTEQERKPIMKMWIKQFIRETVYRVGRFEDDSLELKNGKCNDILEEYFDKEEIDEISDMIGPADIKDPEGHRRYSNITMRPMGVLAKADESGRIPIPDNAFKFTDRSTIHTESEDLTLPSHWKYCDWKLTQRFKEENKKYHKIFSYFPLLWLCDGKCNTNNGDDQAWYVDHGGREIPYLDLNDGQLKTHKYMKYLVANYLGENTTEKGIHNCYTETYIHSIQYDSPDDCERYQNFVKDCLAPIDKCLGNIAIREIVLFAIVREFKPETCYEASNASYLLSNSMLTLLFVLFHSAINSMQ